MKVSKLEGQDEPRLPVWLRNFPTLPLPTEPSLPAHMFELAATVGWQQVVPSSMIAHVLLFWHVVVVCALYIRQLRFIAHETAKESACYEWGR